MLNVISREYKVVLDHLRFEDRKQAALHFWEELRRFAKPLHVKTKGEFEKTQSRRLVFLDTPDRTIYLTRLVFRRRTEKNNTEFTLKCRSPDRYFAADAPIAAANGLKSDEKLEEDIAAPFESRFSRSVTAKSATDTPTTLADAAAIFPILECNRPPAAVRGRGGWGACSGGAG